MLSLVAVDFRTAGFERLALLAGVPGEVVTDVVTARDDVAGAVLLSTCNRFEVYLDVAAVSADAAVAAVVGAAALDTGLSTSDVLAHAVRLDGEPVAEHLFAVAGGLESMVLGEAEIGGQVSRALERARAAGTTSAALERVFQRAARASAAVQHTTDLPGAGRSMVRLALDLAVTRLGDWSATSVVLVGTGAYAAVTLAALRERGAQRIGVYSPSGRAAGFTRRHGVRVVERAELPVALGRAELVIACSTATTPVVGADDLRAGRRVPGAVRRQVVVDLGLPRNVDPAVIDVEGVDLLDLDLLALHAPLPQLAPAADARAVLDRELAGWRAAQQATAAVPAVVALRTQVQALVDDEIDRLRRRGHATPEVERALRHLGGVFVHTPSVLAGELGATGRAEEFAAALRLVHGIDADVAGGSADGGPVGEPATA